MILLIASNLKISVKTVTKNKFIRLNINWYEKWNYILNYCFLPVLVSSSYSQIKGKCVDAYGKGIPTNISVKEKLSER
jgi:hypothetical protein